jgi:transketolase
MRDAFIAELFSQAQNDPRIMLVVGDLGYGVVDTFAKDLPNQFLNTGVAEQNMIGVAAGLAAGGYKVFVYSIANFPTLRCLEQIRNDICYHSLNVTIVSVGAGVSYGTLGYTHFAVEDIAVMRALPGMRVICPADPIEARLAVHDVLAEGSPSYVRLGKNGEPVLHPVDTLQSLAEPVVIREGKDVTILGTGSIVLACLEAANELSAIGIEAKVVSCPTIKPLSMSWISSLGGTPVVTVEEHSLDGGFGSAVLEGINDSQISVRLKRVGIKETRLSELGSASYMREIHGLSPNAISQAVRQVIS